MASTADYIISDFIQAVADNLPAKKRGKDAKNLRATIEIDAEPGHHRFLIGLTAYEQAAIEPAQLRRMEFALNHTLGSGITVSLADGATHDLVIETNGNITPDHVKNIARLTGETLGYRSVPI